MDAARASAASDGRVGRDVRSRTSHDRGGWTSGCGLVSGRGGELGGDRCVALLVGRFFDAERGKGSRGAGQDYEAGRLLKRALLGRERRKDGKTESEETQTAADTSGTAAETTEHQFDFIRKYGRAR